MGDVYDLNKKRIEKFNDYMDLKNERFMEQYRLVSRPHRQVLKERFGEGIDIKEFITKEYATLFKDEKEFQAFIGQVLKRANISDLKKEEFTFEKNDNSASLVHDLARHIFEKKYPQYKEK